MMGNKQLSQPLGTTA